MAKKIKSYLTYSAIIIIILIVVSLGILLYNYFQGTYYEGFDNIKQDPFTIEFDSSETSSDPKPVGLYTINTYMNSNTTPTSVSDFSSNFVLSVPDQNNIIIIQQPAAVSPASPSVSPSPSAVPVSQTVSSQSNTVSGAKPSKSYQHSTSKKSNLTVIKFATAPTITKAPTIISDPTLQQSIDENPTNYDMAPGSTIDMPQSSSPSPSTASTVVPPPTILSETIVITPKTTNPTNPHLADIFPNSYTITIIFKSSMYDISGSKNSIDTATNTMIIGENGQLLDNKFNVIGFAGKDIFNPHKFKISVYDNKNVGKIKISFTPMK
jgi:hypothetical protein